MQKGNDDKNGQILQLLQEISKHKRDKDELNRRNELLEKDLLVEREKSINLEKHIETCNQRGQLYEIKTQLQDVIQEKETLEEVLKNFLLQRELEKLHISVTDTEQSMISIN